MKATLAGACAFLLLLAVSQAAAPQAEVPTWNVGDTWAMGANNLDLAPLIQYIMENIQQQYPGMSTNFTGTLSVYEIFEVAEVQTTQYKVAVSIGLEVKMSGTLTYAGESGSLNFTLVAKADGFVYFTKDTLALAKEELSGDMDLTMSMQAAGQTMDVTMDATFQTTVTYSPALDIFDFPITVGDNWTAESTAALAGTISGKMSMTGYGEQSFNTPFSTTTSVSIPFQCPSTTNVTLEDGSVSTCYKITQPGASIEGVTPTPLGGTVYYSPDRGFIVKQDLLGLPGAAGKGGGMSLGGVGSTASLGSITPMTKQAAQAGIAGLGVAGGIDIVLLAVIGIVFVVVIGVVIAVLVIRRMRTASTQTAEI